MPEYLTDQTEDVILGRMLENLPSDLDKTEGSYIWDALSPAAIEFALSATQAQEVLRRGFASTTYGAYLDLRCEEHGITRRPAVKATGKVKISGVAGTLVPAGTRVATLADTVTSFPSVEFVTLGEIILDEAGSGFANVEAVEAGAAGNVSAGAISILVSSPGRVSGVTNESATSGGLDIEDDKSLLDRYLQRVRSPSAGGNKADYVNWALEVPGVGGVSVVPVRDGPGTVSVAIIDAGKSPASQALVDQVQEYIAPPWVNELEAETMTLSGFGVTVDSSQSDDTGDSVKMVYNAGGTGMVAHLGLHTVLQQPGIWQARIRVKVDDSAGVGDLLQVGVWNVSASNWAKVDPSGAADAVMTLQANDMATAFADVIQEFYWNGQDQLELRLVHLPNDTTTMGWIDQVVYRSTFSKDTGEGKAPIGARVMVESATSLLVNVSATLTIAQGYNADSVKAAAEQAISDYIHSLAFTDDNDVRYVRIGQAILDTPGVEDYANLLVNGGSVNISVGVQEVAILGTVTWA